MDCVCLASVISGYLLMPYLMLRFTPFPVLQPRQVTVMLGNFWTLLYPVKRLGLHIINHFISVLWVCVCVVFYVWNMWTSPNNTFLCQTSTAAVLRYSLLQLVFSCMLLWVGGDWESLLLNIPPLPSKSPALLSRCPAVLCPAVLKSTRIKLSCIWLNLSIKLSTQNSSCCFWLQHVLQIMLCASELYPYLK